VGYEIPCYKWKKKTFMNDLQSLIREKRFAIYCMKQLGCTPSTRHFISLEAAYYTRGTAKLTGFLPVVSCCLMPHCTVMKKKLEVQRVVMQSRVG